MYFRAIAEDAAEQEYWGLQWALRSDVAGK